MDEEEAPKTGISNAAVWLILCSVPLICIAILKWQGPGDNYQKQKQADSTNTVTSTAAKLKDDIGMALFIMDAKTSIEDFTTNETLVGIADDCGKYRQALWQGLQSNDKETVKLAKKLKAKLPVYQASIYKRLRRQYVVAHKHESWLQDIEMSVSGSKSDNLVFVGWLFANNSNKEEFMLQIHEIVNRLRFKKVTFKWIEHEDQYTYYTIKSPADTDINL